MQPHEFEAHVTQYRDLVMALIRRHYGGQLGHHAEDLSQEVWAKLWESLKKNETNVVSFKSYLYRTVQTTLWDAVEKLKREGLQPIDEELELPALQDVQSETLAAIEVEQRLESFSKQEQQMMQAHLKGFNYADIAALLGISEGRVRNSLSRMKKKMTAR